LLGIGIKATRTFWAGYQGQQRYREKLLIKQKPRGIRMMGGKHMGLKKVDSPHLDAEQKY